jgi:hypothetical protein
MRNLAEVFEYLKQQGLKLSGPLARQDGEKSILYAFIEVSRDSKGHQKPSNIALGKVTKNLSETGIFVKFILNDVSNLDFEAGLRATLLHAFPNLVRNCFLTADKEGAVVWIVPKGAAVRDNMEEITGRVLIYLENASMSLAEVKLTVDENLPSRTAILSELRIAAPVSAERLAERLTAKGFVEPPIDYLNRNLDALRRADQVVRRKDAQYCLTAGALKILGTVKRRSSPDITRFLDLARRGDLQ